MTLMKPLLWLLASTLCHSVVQAETLLFFAAAGVKIPAEVIIQAFEKSTGHTVVRVYDTAGAAEAQFVEGKLSGLLITTEPRILQSKVLKDGVMQRVGDTLAGIAISPAFALANPQLSVATPHGLKQALLAAKRIAYSDPARGATVGAHFIKVLDQLDIRQALLTTATTARDGIETMQRVAKNEADLGVTQVSEIVQSDPKLLLGAFPAELELATRYNSWQTSSASPAVQALAAAFGSAQGKASLQQFGLRLP